METNTVVKERELNTALSKMRAEEGSDATDSFVYQVLRDTASPKMKTIARKLAHEFPGMGEATSLEVLAAIGRILDVSVFSTDRVSLELYSHTEHCGRYEKGGG